MDAYEIHKRMGDLLRADVAGGRLEDLATYQRRFPGHDDLVAAEYRAAVEGVAPSTSAVDPADIPAQHRSHYATLGEIARGGMGTIFHVRDDVLERDLAMKVILAPDGSPTGNASAEHDLLTRRFLEEAKITAQLDHPGVVPVYELGADEEGRFFFTMKMVRGQTLAEVFSRAREGSDDWSRNRVLRIFIQILETLAFAHEKGIVHRDLKPENIMVGGFGEVYVMDWGLAKVMGRDEPAVGPLPPSGNTGASQNARLTSAGEVLGTPAYMAPEQARNRGVDGRSDVYATGALLYEFLTGRHPYGAREEPPPPQQVLREMLKGPPTPLLELAPYTPPELAAIVEKALARDRSARYPSAVEFARDLSRFVDGRVVEAHGTGTWITARKWVERNRALSASLGAALLFLLLGFVAAVTLGVRAELAAQRVRQENEASRQQAYLANIAAAVSELDRQDVESVRYRLLRVPADLRGWAWQHLMSHLDESLTVIDGISHAFAPDGGQLLVLDRAGVVRAWDLDQGISTVVLETGAASDVAWLDGRGDHHLEAIPDPQGGDRWTLRIRSLRGSEAVREIHFVSPDVEDMNWEGVFGTEGWRRSTVLPWFLYHDADRRLAFHDVRTGEVRRPDLPTRALSRGISPNRRKLLLDTVDVEQIRILDLDHPDAHLAIPCPRESRVLCAAWTPDQAHLVTSGADRSVRLLDGETGELTGWGQVGGHTEVVTALAIHPEGSLLATGGHDHLILLRDLASGALRGAYHGHEHGVSSLSFSPDGEYLASTDIGGKVRVWSGTGDEFHVLRGHASYVYDVAFSPDGRRVYSGGWDGFADQDGHIRVWDAASGESIAALGGPDQCTFSLSVTADGSRLLTTGGERDEAWGGGPISVWDTATGRLLRRLPGSFRRLALSPDETRVLAARQSGVVDVLDLQTGEVLKTLVDARRTYGNSTPAWSPDGRWIACRGEDVNTFSLWNARTYARVRTFRGHTDAVQAIAFSPDSPRIVSSSVDHTARVWDVGTGRELAVLTGHGASVLTASFRADGTRILTGGRDGNLRLWDADTYVEIVRLTGHETYVIGAAVSPDGQMIATASGDHTVRLWGTEPLRERHRQRRMRRAAVRELKPHVERLFARLDAPEAVVEALRNDDALDDRQREIALQIALALSVAREGGR